MFFNKNLVHIVTETRTMILLFLVLACGTSVQAVEKINGYKQPDVSNLTHCLYYFSTFNASTVTCNNITDGVVLRKNMEIFRGTIDSITDIYFNNTIINNWLPGIFKGLVVQRVQFVDSELVSLKAVNSDEFILAGLENSLECLTFRNVLVGQWDWLALSEMNALRILEVIYTNVNEIPSDFKKVADGQLSQILIEGHKLTGKISDDAFSSFTNMLRIRLSNNSIDVVKRSMFPSPAKLLESFILDNNLITTLPDDLFDKMPKLIKIYVANNKLTTVGQQFQKTWEKVKTFLLSGNPLNCDCKLKWLLTGIKTTEMMTKYVRGLRECAKPPNLQGKYLRNLQESDLVCN